MVRKRTFQDMQPGAISSPGYSACDSSPSSLPFPDYQFLSSPDTSISTLASSPMSRNASTQSCFSTFSPSQHQPNEFAGGYDESPQSTLYAPFPSFSPTLQQPFPPDDANERPGMKRRKTMPEVNHLSPTAHAKARDVVSPIRGGGRDGEDVWPPAVEECFQTALRLLPRLGRKKLIIQGKPCGRNELIADYIFRHTGKMRTRKQVSSHIQVLKNLKKDDEEFMFLVSDPVEGEDQFLPGNADLFFGKQGMASRHAPPVFLERSLSASNVPHHPPIDLSSSTPVHHGLAAPFAPPPSHATSLNDNNTLHSPFVMHPSPSSATTPTSGLTRAMQGMSVAVTPSPSLTLPVACPIAPARMLVVASTSTGDKGHVYARLEASNGPTRRVFLEDLPMWEKRYSSIPAMNDHLPCQFLHVHLPLSIPGINGTALDQALETQLRVTAVQALPLTSITSIYCHGDLVITYEDTLTPRELDLASRGGPLEHEHFYDVPFGADFWTMLLRGGQDGVAEPTLRKSAKERQALADMLPGFSVVQEFVVPSEHAADRHDALSPGSSMGDVVLVVVYDLEVSKGAKAQSGEISFLSLRRSLAASPPAAITLPVPPSDFGDASIYPVAMTRPTEVPQLVMHPSEYYSALEGDRAEELSSGLETARPTIPSHSMAHKPNLSLHIPPPPRFSVDANGARFAGAGHNAMSSAQPSPSIVCLSATGPITPWGQVVHTPTHPPPVLAPSSAAEDAQRDRTRLEAAWRANAAETNNRWDLDSPALYAPPPPSLPSYDNTEQYGFYDFEHHDHIELEQRQQPLPRSDPQQQQQRRSRHEAETTFDNSSLSSFAMDRRSLSTPNFSSPAATPSTMRQHQKSPGYQHQAGRAGSSLLLPSLPSATTLAANFNTGANSYSPSPLSSFSSPPKPSLRSTARDRFDPDRHHADPGLLDSTAPSLDDSAAPVRGGEGKSNGNNRSLSSSSLFSDRKPIASQSEQDAFFSNLLGSTTRYTVTS